MISGGDWSGSLVLLKYFYANHLCWLFFVAQDLLFLHSEFYINAEIVVDAVLRYGINQCGNRVRSQTGPDIGLRFFQDDTAIPTKPVFELESTRAVPDPKGLKSPGCTLATRLNGFRSYF